MKTIKEFENLKVLVQQYLEESPDFDDVRRGIELARQIGVSMGKLEIELMGE